jgi:hypothetical protein
MEYISGNYENLKLDLLEDYLRVWHIKFAKTFA